MSKVLGIVCSPRKQQTSYKALEHCINIIKKENENIDTQIIELADYEIKPCIACGKCSKGLQCSQNDDFTNKLIDILNDNNIKSIIISTPVYMGTMTSQCKSFIDRTVMFRRNGFKFKNKIGGVIAVGHSRNGGQEITVQSVQSAMLIHDMIVVGDGCDSAHFGGTVFSGIENDEFGYKTVANLGKRVVELINLIKE